MSIKYIYILHISIVYYVNIYILNSTSGSGDQLSTSPRCSHLSGNGLEIVQVALLMSSRQLSKQGATTIHQVWPRFVENINKKGGVFQIQTHLSSYKDIVSTHIFESLFDFWSLGSLFFLLGFQWNFHTSLEWSVGMANPEAEPPRMRKRLLSKKEASSKQQNKTISPAKTPKTMWQFLG